MMQIVDSNTDRLVLVTGVAGFIGSNVARSFAEAGFTVVGSDRMGVGGKWRNLADVALHDIVTPENLPAWLAAHRGEIALIVHLGAISTTTETDIDAITRDNIRLSLDLWDYCRAENIRFIYASSAATYGDGDAGFADDESLEALAKLRPMNAYGWSKLLVDRRILADAKAGRAAPAGWAGLKFFNVYGPGENHKGDMRSVVNKIIPGVRNGDAVRLFRSYRSDYADGGQKRDFIFIDDVVDVIRWLAEKPGLNGLYNLGTGFARTWNDLARAVFTACKMPQRITYIDMPEHIRQQYQYFTEAPMQKLRAAGWNRPFTSLEDGVQIYVQREQRYTA